MQPEVSIIIPAFGRAAALKRAIASALAGGVDDIEIIVIDDGTAPPLTLDIGEARVRLLRETQNRGAAAARNLGLAAARGTWIALLDSDDEWPPGSLARRLRFAEAAGDAPPRTIWTAGFQYVRDGAPGEIRYPRAARAPTVFAAGCWFCPGSTALFRRDPLVDLAGPQDERLRRLEDYDWFLRWSLAGGGIAVAPMIGALVTRGPKAPSTRVRAAAQIVRETFAHLDTDVKRRLEAYLALEIGASALAERDYAAAALALSRSWRLKPRLSVALEAFWTDAPRPPDAIAPAH